MTFKLPSPAVFTTRTYEIIAFVTGFVLMVFELVASRMLAPTIGSSMYVWTSVIGVIIAALSVGYACGGRLADKRVNSQDISWLLLACAICITYTLLTSSILLDAIGGLAVDARLKGLLAACLLFLPASFVVGTISPYLVRLHTQSVTVAGRSVASLSALNAIGGIVGTFSAGFIFFSYIGSRQTLVLIILLLIASSWLVRPRFYWAQRALLSVALALISTSTLLPSASASAATITIDTPSAHYQVMDTAYGDKAARVLSTGPGAWQSGILIDRPNTLAFSYARYMADVVSLAPHKQNILVLGGGAFTIPEYLARSYPLSQIDVVEIDPQLEQIAIEHFDYTPLPNVHSISQDGRAFLNSNTKQYDLILADIYSDINIPFAVTTSEYTRVLRSALKPHGAVITNIIASLSPQCTPLLGALHSTYTQQLPYYAALPTHPKTLQSEQNMIVVYAPQQEKWITRLDRGLKLPDGTILHDNFAPVERLRQQCS